MKRSRHNPATAKQTLRPNTTANLRALDVRRMLAEIERGNATQLGSGNFGQTYRVVVGRNPYVVKVPVDRDIHGRLWSPHELREAFQAEAKAATSLFKLGHTVVPRAMYVEVDGLPVIVREYGEPTTLTQEEYDDLSTRLRAVVDAGWTVEDELLVLRRPNRSLFVADVGLWRPYNMQRKRDRSDAQAIANALVKGLGRKQPWARQQWIPPRTELRDLDALYVEQKKDIDDADFLALLTKHADKDKQKAIKIREQAGFMRHNSATAKRTHPALWEQVKAEVTASSKGGRPGQWSARKAQFAVAEYKARGGGYIGPKTPDNALTKWTEERWRTRSGLPSLETGERYLPTRAITALTASEYAATSKRKRAGMRRGQQFVPQPESVAMKTAKYRRNPSPTDTAAFKKWFSGSKVVDANGHPLVVYHGTNAHAYSPGERISVFGTSNRGGAFFSDSRDIARQYGEQIYEVYLHIENPLVVYAEGKYWTNLAHSKIGGSVTDALRHASAQKAETHNKEMADLAELFDDPWEPVTPTFTAKTKSLSGYTLDSLPGLRSYDTVETDDVARVARKLGFDGVIFVQVQDSPTAEKFYNRVPSNVYAVFRPTQIKSATDNRGTFDPTDSDIRHNPLGVTMRTRRNSDEPRVGDQWSWGEHTREIVAIEERNGERRIGVRESESPGVLMIYRAEEFPAHKAREMAQHAKWEAKRPEREREQRERVDREAREAARREEAEAAERSLVARLRAFATAERLTEKQKEKMKVDFRNQVQYKGKVYTIAELIEEKIKVDGWNVDEDGIDGPGGAFIAKKSITPLGLRYAQYLWHREHPPAPEPPITAKERALMAELFGPPKPKRR